MLGQGDGGGGNVLIVETTLTFSYSGDNVALDDEFWFEEWKDQISSPTLQIVRHRGTVADATSIDPDLRDMTTVHWCIVHDLSSDEETLVDWVDANGDTNQDDTRTGVLPLSIQDIDPTTVSNLSLSSSSAEDSDFELIVIGE